MTTAMKFEGGAAMLLMFAVLAGMVADGTDTGAAVLKAEIMDRLEKQC